MHYFCFTLGFSGYTTEGMCFSGCIQKLTLRALVMLMGLAAAGLLGVALVGQYGFSLHPCELCLYQRYPYALIALLGLAAWFIASPKLLKCMALLGVALFLLDGGIAIYHAGVELGWFPGLAGCSNHASQGQTLEQMRAEIMHAPLVTCDQAMIHVWGLSMAAWNAMAALVLAVVSGFLLVKLNKVQRT